MTNSQKANISGAVTTKAALPESKTSTPAKKTKAYSTLMVNPTWEGLVSLRMLNVLATGKLDARALADRLTRRLTYEQIEAITVDPWDYGECPDEAFVVAVYETYSDIPGQAWTREQVESKDFDACVKRAAETLETELTELESNR